MIPLKLTLKNFLCYGDGVPTLDLEGIHVACLCGQNGHGKSALLDAITWALWCKARGKTQDELIHYGNDEMLVELEFLARDTRYRAARRHATGRSRRRQGATDLQLQVYTGEAFHPITGNSMRETQAKIDQITGMDYETFINSAFLMQGRADEFTNKTPGERKEVLAKILGLGYYDRLEDRARERTGEKKLSASIVEGDLERMRREVSRRDGYHSELEAVNGGLAKVNGRLETSAQALDALKIQVENLRRKRGELEEVERRIPSIEEDISHLQMETETSQGRISDYRTLIHEKESIQGGLVQLRQLRQRYEELNRSRELFDGLKGRKSGLEKTIESARARLDEQVRQLERRIEAELRPRADAVPTIGVKLEEARRRLDELAKEEQSVADSRQYLQGLATRIGELRASAQQLGAEGQELRSKLGLVQNSHEGARCPLCDTELGPQECQRLLDNYSIQIEDKRKLYRENEAALKAAEEKKLVLDKELPRRDAALRRGQQDTQKSVAVLERQMEESHKASAELEQVSHELAQDKGQLEQGTYATEERERLMELETQIGTLGYDSDAHRRLYDEMQELQLFEERHRRLEEAAASLPQEQESLARAQAMYQRRQEDLSTDKARKRDMEAEVSELPRGEERLREAETAYRELEIVHTELFRKQVELEGDLNRVEALEMEMDDKERALKTLREEQGVYQQLVEGLWQAWSPGHAYRDGHAPRRGGGQCPPGAYDRQPYEPQSGDPAGA